MNKNMAVLLPLTLWGILALLLPLMSLMPNGVNLEAMLQAPSSTHWLGTDELGRPVLDRLLVGARVSFLVSISVVAVSGVIGTLLGTMAALAGGWFDRLLTAVVDLLLAFPGILLAIAISAVLGPGIGNLVLALSFVGWVGFARLSRAQVLSLKHRDHVTAAVSLGAGRQRIVFRHLIPLALAPLMVEATFGVAAVIIAEAGLSFLGLGVQPPNASWGSMIREGTRYMLVAPHLVIAPGIAILLVVLAVNLAGDRLRDWLAGNPARN
jgi:peptide/nickel transport system permease protein